MNNLSTWRIPRHIAGSSLARRPFTCGPHKYPALHAWRAELARGVRTLTTFDALWRAACREQHAIEYQADGLPSISEGFRTEARQIIHEAAGKEVA